MARPPARRLKLQDPRVVKIFLDKLDKLFNYHKVYHKLAALVAEAEYPLTFDMQEDFEKLDKVRTQCMVAAEKQCRRLCMGTVPWSSACKAARDVIDFWTCLK